MTARLPSPGGDAGAWGDILNTFLEVSHNADGTLQSSAIQQAGGVITSQIGTANGVAALNSSGRVPTGQLGSGSASNANFLRGDGAWATPADAVTSVFGRTGTVAAQSGDYTASQVTNAADKSSNSTQTFTGNLIAPAIISSGLTGATAATRYVGGTVSGAPVSGTFTVGDFVVDQAGTIWVYATGGTWTRATLLLDSTAADIQPLGTQSAGSTGKAADAGHVHPWTAAEPITGGEVIRPRSSINDTLTIQSGTMLLSYWTAISSGSASTISTLVGGTAASGLTLARIGVYSVDSSDNLTLLASTGNIAGSAWLSTYTLFSASLTSTFTRTVGSRYAVGFLAVGTTPPSLYAAGNTAFSASFNPIEYGAASPLSDLPSSLTSSGLYGNWGGPAAAITA